MVAGVIALMLEANSDLSWRDIQHILVRTSKKLIAQMRVGSRPMKVGITIINMVTV